MNARETLDAWFATRDPREVVRLARGLAPADRRAVAAELPRYLRDLRDAAEFGWLDDGPVRLLLAAGAATIGGAAGVAGWVTRRELREVSWSGQRIESGGHLSHLVRTAVADRPEEWRADLLVRVTARLRRSGDDWRDFPVWVLAAELARDLGGPPPATDAFVLGWTLWGERLCPLDRDPFLGALLPRIFEVDGIGGGLTWAGTLTSLAREGRVERTMLIDGCVGRFLRGGRASDLRWFVRLYEALETTVDEAAARVRDLVRLLPTAPPPVADLALREIRRVDETRPLDAALFTEAADAVLFRPEKKLVRAALIWLDRTARKHDRAEATLRSLTPALDADDLDLRERAHKLVTKLGGEVAADVPPPPPPPGLPPYVPREAPAPITTPAELAEVLHARLTHGWTDGPFAGFEQVMAGLVELTYRDRDGVRDALLRVVPGRVDGAADSASWVARAIRQVFAPRSQRLRNLLGAQRRQRRWADAIDIPLPELFLRWRMLAVPQFLGRVPVLLSTPTAASGHVDPDVLVARMRQVEESGHAPATADLHQALLRVPRDIGTDAVKAATDLQSVAGQTLATWLASGGLPEPTVTCASFDLPFVEPYRYREMPADAARVLPTVRTGDDDLPHEIRQLVRLPARKEWTEHPRYSFRNGLACWPTLMPSHREVIAAHLVAYLAGFHDQAWGVGGALLALAEADGRAGPATATVLAYGLTSSDKGVQADATEALLTFGARGHLPAADLGTAIATLHGQGLLKVNRVTTALDEAARAGAYADVWTTLTAALPVLFPEPGERPATGLTDLLALATRTAETLGVLTDLPGLADLAARGGSGRVVREAARLHLTLTKDR